MHDPGIDIGTCPSEEFGPIGKMLMVASKWLAIAGGIVLVALVVMSVVSIVGRKLWSAPVPGDVEVLQLSAASSVSTFFAWCHLTRGDVKVDFFTNSLPRWAIDMLDGVDRYCWREWRCYLDGAPLSGLCRCGSMARLRPFLPGRSGFPRS